MGAAVRMLLVCAVWLGGTPTPLGTSASRSLSFIYRGNVAPCGGGPSLQRHPQPPNPVWRGPRCAFLSASHKSVGVLHGRRAKTRATLSGGG